HHSPKRPLVSRHTTSTMAPLIANSPDWNMRSEMNVTSLCQARFLLLKKSNWHGERHADPLTGPTQVGGGKGSQLANKEIGTCLIGSVSGPGRWTHVEGSSVQSAKLGRLFLRGRCVYRVARTHREHIHGFALRASRLHPQPSAARSGRSTGGSLVDHLVRSEG